MRTGVAGFQGPRLLQARQARGITQVALSQTLEVTSATVSKWEKGAHVPEARHLDGLSKTLGVPQAWFFRPMPVYGDRPYFFRDQAAATREARLIAKSRIDWLHDIANVIQHWVDWPDVSVPCAEFDDSRYISDSDVERWASECRSTWSLGMGPISDMVLVLENAGVICAREEIGYSKMDGLSHWMDEDGRPYVYLVSDKGNGCRGRFDAAHELGHLVLHRNLADSEFTKHYRDIENQAHRFGGAFLLPAESFAAEVSVPSLDTFLALKPRWKVSVKAMIMRCKQLDIISDEYATRLYKHYSARGWQKGEPYDDQIKYESIRLLPRAVDLVVSNKMFTRDALRENIGLNARDCESLCGLPFGYFDVTNNVVSMDGLKLKDRTQGLAQITGNVVGFPMKKADA